MRVILDTNVLLAALISPHGAPHMIYKAWRAGRFELVTSAAQLEEIRQASRYPKLKAILPAHRVGAMINNMQRAVVLGDMRPLKEDVALHDPNDAFLVSMAIEVQSNYLLTGDRRAGLLQMGSIRNTRIMTPTDFCSTILRI